MTDYSYSTFDSIRHTNEFDAHFWYARELMVALEYADWKNFVKVIRKAMLACRQSGNDPANHFSEIGKMIELGKGAQRKIIDLELSRYACYLIVMNGDPGKEIIAQGQTYFAVRTRHDEIMEQHYELLSEEDQRLHFRGELHSRNNDSERYGSWNRDALVVDAPVRNQ